MRNYYHLALALILSSMLSKICAQGMDYQYSLDLSRGLTSEIIQDMVFDDLGQLWIGTEYGLNKYDGTNITKYYYNPLDTNSISANNIKQLYKGPNGNIWAVLTVGGVCKFDINTSKFSLYLPSEPEEKLANYINDLIWNESFDMFFINSKWDI